MAITTTPGVPSTVRPAGPYKKSARDEWLEKHCGYNPVGEAVCDPNDPWFRQRETDRANDPVVQAVEAVAGAAKDKYLDQPDEKEAAKTLGKAGVTLVQKGFVAAAGVAVPGLILEPLAKAVVVGALPILSETPQDRQDESRRENEAEYARRHAGMSVPDEPDAGPAAPDAGSPTGEADPAAEAAAQASLPAPDVGQAGADEPTPDAGSPPPYRTEAGEAAAAPEEEAQASLPAAPEPDPAVPAEMSAPDPAPDPEPVPEMSVPEPDPAPPAEMSVPEPEPEPVPEMSVPEPEPPPEPDPPPPEPEPE